MCRDTSVLLAVCAAAAMSCGAEDPTPERPSGTEEEIKGLACPAPPDYAEDVTSCAPLAIDYQPRDSGSANDSWAACISDDGTYHRVEQSVSSIARAAAYAAIGALLWEGGATPGRDAFLAARLLFEEEQGLGSRVARRYDVHYPAPDSGGCGDGGVAQAYPDYCVGPAKLQPIVVEAFADGMEGNSRIVNAAKIRVALQWFFYVSAIKEATTCADAAKDCDSSWAYYSGGSDRDSPSGLAADIDAVAPATHDRVFDGVLAVRCWRDLDQAVPAADLDLRDRAIDQLDQALVRGMSILVRQYFLVLECSTGDHQQAALEALKILVLLLDRETRERQPAAADLLTTQMSRAADAIDVTAAVAALDATYPCP